MYKLIFTCGYFSQSITFENQGCGLNFVLFFLLLICWPDLTTMVFCYQNCSDLLWEKIVLVIEKKLLKFVAEGQEFAKFLRSLKQFVRKMKGQNNFW